MNKKLIVLVGMQGSGKSTLLNNIKTAKVLKPSTERSRRENESDEYYFESRWEDNSYAWEIARGNTRYGMRQTELDSEFLTAITVFDPSNIEILISKIEKIPYEVITVGIDTLETIEDQHARVNNDSKRLVADSKIFLKEKKAVQNCDVVIKGDAQTLLNAFESVIDIINGRGGRLHDEAIKNLIAANCLLENGDENLIQTASYDLSLGDKYWCQGKYITLDDKNTTAEIPPYSYILVQAKEMANLPRFIAADFDTTVSLFLNGIILSNGPQVDPGYKGALFCMLYNASHTRMGITRGKHFATIQFTTTTKVATGYRDKYQNKKQFQDFLDGKVSVSPGGQIFEELDKVEKRVKGEVVLWRTALITMNIGAMAALIAIVIGSISAFNSNSQERFKSLDAKIKDIENLEAGFKSKNKLLEDSKILMDQYLYESKQKLSDINNNHKRLKK